MSGKVQELDGLRGLAAINVVFSHTLLWMYPYLHRGSVYGFQPTTFAQHLFNSPVTFFYKGTAAVILFFIMSGSIEIRRPEGVETLRF